MIARRRDERLVAVLLEEHPLQRLCAAEPIAGHERRALGEIPEDRVRLGEVRAVVELERRNAAVRVALQKLRRARRAGIDVEVRPVVAQTRAARAAGGPCSRCRNPDCRIGAWIDPLPEPAELSLRRRRGAAIEKVCALRLSYP